MTTWAEAYGVARCGKGKDHFYLEKAYPDGCPVCRYAEADRRPGEDESISVERARYIRDRLGLDGELRWEAERQRVLRLLADPEIRTALREALGIQPPEESP